MPPARRTGAGDRRLSRRAHADRDAAVGFLESLIRRVPRTRAMRERLGLSPTTRLLERMGSPHERLACIHVTGSKGKGATALYAERLLTEAGLGVGTFTSPHLEDWNERIRIGGRPIDGAAFASGIESTRAHVEALRTAVPDDAPAFFETLTAAALWLFDRAGVDVAVIEAGIGGRIDATNVVRTVTACITTVELEHTDKLGESLEAIATEKAGIVKSEAPVIVGRLAPAALAPIAARAAAYHAPLRALDAEIRLDAAIDATNARATIELAMAGLSIRTSIPAPAPHLADVAALAIACVHSSGLLDEATLHRAAEALAGCALPARVEILSRSPWVLVDGAHTEASVRALAGVLDRLAWREMVLVASLTADKSAERVLEPVARRAARIVATRAEPTRSMPSGTLARRLRAVAPNARIDVVDDAGEALRRARAATHDDMLLCACGSMYLAGRARRVLGGPATP